MESTGEPRTVLIIDAETLASTKREMFSGWLIKLLFQRTIAGIEQHIEIVVLPSYHRVEL